MRWEHLRFVLAVGRHGSLAGAAKELGVQATTIGRRLAATEEELGARLFARTPDGLRPTAAGARVIECARAVEERTHALARSLGAGDSHAQGAVRVTAVDSLLDAYLLPRLGPFLERWPGVTPVLIADVRELDLARDQADVALRFRRPKHPDLAGARLATLGAAFYASRAYLDGWRSRGGGAHRLVKLPQEFDESPDATSYARVGGECVLRVATPSQMRSAVRASLGVGLLTCFEGDADPALVRVAEAPELRDELWAVCHADVRRSARVRAMVDYLKEVTARDAELLRGSAGRRG